MRRALIVGSEGQDGRILFDRLTSEGLSVVGLGRESVRTSEGATASAVALHSRAEVGELLRTWMPTEIYYLAAVHQGSQDPAATDDAELFERSLRVHVDGIVNVLDGVRQIVPRAAVFYAASSLLFGDVDDAPQTERTPFRPRCIYGITKAAGVEACRYYRTHHHLHASVGIFYNHESPLRKPEFVSTKIVNAAVAIAAGRREKLVVGNLSSQVDWSYAPDVMDAAVSIVRQPEADDYIVASGEAHTVQEFVEIAFTKAGLEWREHVEELPSLLTRPPVARVGDASRLRHRTGWRPSVDFRQMVERLVEAQLGTHGS